MSGAEARAQRGVGERVRIGLLHPGEMGASVGAAAAAVGADVRWASERRSQATSRRAQAAGFPDAGSLDRLVESADVIFSVCPPHAAIAVAEAVAARRFGGVLVDMNAIAPATARRIGELVEHGGGGFVDGGIIGPPVAAGSGTRLYLSGPEAKRIGSLFAGSALEVAVVDQRPGSASAVKACYASWSKASAALLLGIRALARAEGVEAALLEQWSRSLPGLAERSERVPTASARKAWRWIGEMEQLAAAFRHAGLPEGFHLAAAEIWRRLEPFKDATPTFDEVVAAATTAPETDSGSG